jgi:hypothetical protein
MGSKGWILTAALAIGAVIAVLIKVNASSPRLLRRTAVKALLINGQLTGYAYTEGGALHRPAQTKCPSLLPRAQAILSSRDRRRLGLPPHGDPVPPDVGQTDSEGDCRFDRDCTQSPHGYCFEPLPSGDTRCNYGCVQDSECSEGICLCDEPVGRCVHAACTTDNDCAAPALCAVYSPSPGCWFEDGFACQSPKDQCATDTDCDGGACGWDAARRLRVCTSENCTY